MSLERRVKIGCYIELPKNKVKLKITNKRKACSNVKCDNNKGIVFDYEVCPRCKSSIEVIEKVITKNERLDWHNFTHDFNMDEGEFIWLKEKQILTSNLIKDIENEDLTVVELNQNHIEKKHQQFLKTHNSSLLKMKEILGEDIVIKYGVISYYI